MVDGNDSFFGGHQIVKARSYKREIPTWARNSALLQKMMLQSFPSLKTNAQQRDGAKRWAAVITLYFVMGYTAGQVATEVGSTKEKIRFVVRSISRAVKGLRADGCGQKGGKRGRPRKNMP